MAMWGGRFGAEAAAVFRKINDSLRVDYRLVQEDVEGSIAWAHALEGAEVLTADEGERLRSALREIGAAARAAPHAVRDAGEEDVHAWVEARLVERAGDLGKKLHTGRSRNDQVATDLRLWTRRQIAHRRREIRAVQASLVDLARREEGTVLPGYTHLQRAQPVLFAHWCMAYFEMLDRDAERFEGASRRAGGCPLGAGALAGTAYPIDRHALARRLGFDGPSANSIDAVSDRDFVVEALFACMLCGLHLSRLAEDLIFFASGEAGFIELDDAVTSGSSIMPQKKNPDALELLRGKTGRLFGGLASASMMMKGLPLAYNKDMQEDKEPLFDAMDSLAMCLQVLLRVLDGMTVRKEAAKRAAEGGYANATELADWLVARDVPFRQAHEEVGRIVRRAIELDLPLGAMPVEEMARCAPRVDESVRVHLTIDAALAKRDAFGGTSPRRVREAVAAAAAHLERATEAGNGNGGAAATAEDVKIRLACIDDIDGIQRLVDYWYEKGENLPRSRGEILESIRNFAVAAKDGRVIACGSLCLYSPVLAEIRSVGVDPQAQGGGIGSGIVRRLLDVARSLHLPRVFVLTRAPQFFARLGFKEVSIAGLPEKVWKDCERCPRRACCDEIAMACELGVGGAEPAALTAAEPSASGLIGHEYSAAAAS
jgi:argininosuccinate lyase/amino-acid N-acetyltransferase